MSSTLQPFRSLKLATETKQARAKLLALGRSTQKAANIGGDQESQFEQALAALAYAYFKDKAPRLLDYLIGFQLVDRNDDNTKAVGVFGFKLGSQWIYAPVFFLNGDLKGHELLYVKSQDQFVPLKEDWVNYLLNRKPHVLGEGTPYTMQQLGVMRPQLNTLNQSPASKQGSAPFEMPAQLADWCRDVLPLLGAAETAPSKLLAKFAGLDERLDLRDFLSQDLRLVTTAVQLSRDYPLLKQAFDKFYGPDLFRDCLVALRTKVAAQTSLLTTPPPAPARTLPTNLFGEVAPRALALSKLAITLKVDPDQPITYNLPEMDEEERIKLHNDGVLIKDKRDPHETSMAYNTQIEMQLVNPTDTGIYELLTREGTFERCLVITSPSSGTGTMEFCTVLRLDGEKAWLNAYRSQLWVRDVESLDDYRKWQEEHENGDKTLTNGATYLAVSPTGQGTVPFTVNKKLDDGCYDVCYKDYASGPRPLTAAPRRYNANGSMGADIGGYDDGRDRLYVNKNEGSKLKSMRGALYLPAKSTILKLKAPPKWRAKLDAAESKEAPEPTPILPGNLADLTLQIMQKTSRLKLYSTRTDYSINNDPPRSKLACLVALVRDHGFTEKSARIMLADADRRTAVTYRVKYADPYLTNQGEYAPPYPQPEYGFDQYPNGDGVQTIEPQSEHTQVPGLEAANTDMSQYDPWQHMTPDSQTLQSAQQAGQQGQKEVFDTTMIGGMLKSTNQDSLVDRYLGDLLKALDRLGRVLFMFYWHNDEFSDRYGKQDMPELEDSLRNTFESLGDVTLFLKNKTVDPYSANIGEPDIGQAAQK